MNRGMGYPVFQIANFLLLCVIMPPVIESHINLQPYNTFKVKAYARYLVRINNANDLLSLLSQPVFKENKRFILGGGSNILFLNDFNGLIIKTEEQEINVLSEREDDISIQVASGVVWHNLVMTCLENNWGGVENLSLIPGTVGAAPIQNIGAYGVEIKNVVQKVEGIDLLTGEHRSFTNSECQFSYRDSIFKQELKKNFFISSVTLRLTKKNHHINSSYHTLKKQLESNNIINPTIQDVSGAVIQVRKSRLPDPAVIGNAGSFFKNPIVTKKLADDLKKRWPAMPVYPFENQSFKVSAGWLIEHTGWKGKSLGNAGVHEHQALVIVNHSNSSGKEIFTLSQKICNDVKNKFGITLSGEVSLIA